MLKRLFWVSIFLTLLALTFSPAFAVLPNIFATQPSGNVPASYLDTNFTFLEAQGVQALTTTGSSNAYVATPADAWVTGYSSYIGRALTVIPNFSNTGAATINVSSLGTASIYKNVAGVQTALASGDITANNPIVLICDGTGFLLVNPATTSASGMTYLATQVFTSSGTYTPTSGMTKAYVRLWGGGGGGGGVSSTAGNAAAGGGAGGYAEKWFTSATIGASQTVTIGAGGTAGANTGGTGGTGGTTSLGALMSATGGVGGAGCASCGALTGGAGGVGSGGDINGTGNYGGTVKGNVTGGEISGYGGATSLGGDGASVDFTQDTVGKSAAANSGSGGSGAAANGTAHVGGVGGSGLLIITEYK